METKKHIKKALFALFIAAALVGAGYGISPALNGIDHPATAVTKTSDIPMVPANFSDLAEKVRPGVVNIQVVKTVKNAGFGVPFPFSLRDAIPCVKKVFWQRSSIPLTISFLI